MRLWRRFLKHIVFAAVLTTTGFNNDDASTQPAHKAAPLSIQTPPSLSSTLQSSQGSQSGGPLNYLNKLVHVFQAHQLLIQFLPAPHSPPPPL